jgi:hypothetical protein
MEGYQEYYVELYYGVFQHKAAISYEFTDIAGWCEVTDQKVVCLS